MASAPPTKKKRKVKEEGRVFQEKWELQYFCTEVNGKIHCLICNNNICTPKAYNLKRHYETNHLSYDKYEGPMRVSKLKELKANLTQQQTLFTKSHKRNVASVIASYELSRMIASNGKSYTEGDFVKQCLVKTAEIVCPEKVHLFKEVSLTRNTVAERIDEMSSDLKQQLKSESFRFEHFSIAIDETVDITGIAQLAVFIRACDNEFNIYEELMELIPMHDTTTSQDIFEKVEQVLHEYDLDLSKLVCLSTDGAANMVGRHNGVGAKLQAKIKKLYPDSSFTHFHCIIHQQNLCSKILKLDHVLSLVTKTVNYIRGRSLNHRQFRQLLEDMDNQFTDVPFYTDVRWLSCHKVLKRFYLLRQEIISFLEMRGQNTDEMKSERWFQDLAFAVDITAQLNDLNLKLQGRNKLITQLYDDVKCFITKLTLWKSQVSNENLVHFPTCKELKNSTNTKSVLSFAKYDSYLELLSKEFEKRFRDFLSFGQQFALFSAPFTFDVAEAEESLQMELLEMQSDSSLRSKYFEVGIPDFFSYLPERFINFRRFGTRILAMFGSTYLCEQLFSFMKSTKTSQRTRLTDHHLSSLIKLGTAQKFQPDIPKIVKNKRCQASGQNMKSV